MRVFDGGVCVSPSMVVLGDTRVHVTHILGTKFGAIIEYQKSHNNTLMLQWCATTRTIGIDIFM